MDARRVLLVDDDADARELVGEFLSYEGFTVETAGDGASALEVLDDFAPDVVVTDLEMPGMNGLELIRRIHARDPDRAALIVTGHEDAHLVREVIERDMPVVWLHTPVDLDELTFVVNRLIDASGASGHSDHHAAAH